MHLCKIKALLIVDDKPIWWSSKGSMSSFIQHQSVNKELITIISDFAKSENLADQVTVVAELAELESAKELLAYKALFEAVLAKAERFSEDLKDIRDKLLRHKVFDVKGKSYHENQVLKGIIEDELKALEVDTAFAKLSSSQLQAELIRVAKITSLLQDALDNNAYIIPLSNIDLMLGELPNQVKLKVALHKAEQCIQYTQYYKDEISVTTTRNQKLLEDRIAKYIEFVIKRLDLEYHQKN